MNGAPDMVVAGLKMIAALGGVLAMILGLLYGMRKITGQRMGTVGGKRIQVIENHYLGIKKSIALVHVPGKVLVLGLSPDRIHLLDTLAEDSFDKPLATTGVQPFGALLGDRLGRLGRKGEIKEKS